MAGDSAGGLAADSAGGLVWAFCYAPGQRPQPAKQLGRVAEGWSWAHFDLVDAQAVPLIRASAELSDFAKEILTGTDEQLRLVAEQDVIAGVLPGFARNPGRSLELVSWRFALQQDLLVTARRAPVRSMVVAWQRACNGHTPDTPLELIGEAVASFAQDMRQHVGTLAGQLNTVEDALLSQGEQDLGPLAPAIGRVRRDATKLKRALDPVMRLMDDDIDELPAWAAGWSHDTAHRLTHAAMDDLQAVQERARSLQDELTARQAEETNRRLYIVSLVTTLILPATFVTGFFGMNTGGMFMASSPMGTLVGAGLCLTSLVGTWLLLRWRRLL
ncbi:MAG: CorA family divalent cation transporter [Janthinobacterium lividum]